MSRHAAGVVYLLVPVGFLVPLGIFFPAWADGAAQHPTVPPVEGGSVDYSACVGCHSDKTEAPVVHAAVGMGCETCHQVDQDEDWTEVFLVTEGNELCYTCHGDKQPQPSQLTLHQPVRRQTCVTCHDPHTSKAANLLRRPAEGREAAENLCLGCHQNIVSQLGKPTQHAAVDLGCATCHTTHKSEPQEAPEGTFHLAQAVPDLCLTCHEAEDEAFGAAHSNQPVGSSRCTECHNPHGSDAPKLVNNYIHGAFELGCETCHAEPQDGKVVLQEGAGREMCLTCHADVEEQMAQAKVVHSPLEMDSGCVGCHSPHAATYEHQLRRGPVNTCLSCHAEFAEARATKQHLHRPVFEASCTVCHQPHGGERPRLLRAETNDLCLECHGRQMGTSIQAGGSVKLFEGTTEIASTSLAGIRLLSIRPGETLNHPLVGHYAGGTHILAGKEIQITCLSCHAPHAASGSPKLLANDAADSMQLCGRCH